MRGNWQGAEEREASLFVEFTNELIISKSLVCENHKSLVINYDVMLKSYFYEITNEIIIPNNFGLWILQIISNNMELLLSFVEIIKFCFLPLLNHILLEIQNN